MKMIRFVSQLNSNFIRKYSSAITITLPKQAFETYNCPSPHLKAHFQKQELLDVFYQMNLIRRMEIAADSLYKSKYIQGFCHLYIGQEAVAVGMKMASSPEDALITAYRCHGFSYLFGNSIESILAELMGKSNGSSKGKGGSMHIFGKNFFGGNGIVGAQVPVGLGIAFAQKYLEKQAVTFALYGDGAANQGQVFESFNMAKLWNIPCIFVCENNKYGMGTSAERSSASTNYYERAGFIPGIKVDGMNYFAVKEACRYAREWAPKNGPLVLEMDTYRYQGHSMSDPGTTYRTREEIKTVRQEKDCIEVVKGMIIEHKIATEEQLSDLVKKAREEVDSAIAKAHAAPMPQQEALFSDVYVHGTGPAAVRGVEPPQIYEEQ